MIETCKYCHSNNIEFKSEFELYNPETDVIEDKEGYICQDCGCFHSEIENFFQISIDTKFSVEVKFVKTDYEASKNNCN